MSDDLPRQWDYRRHGLVVAPGIGRDEWVELWNGLEQTHRSINFFVGDALLAGELLLGEDFAQFVDAKYLEQQRGPLWVCSKIPLPRRRPDLSWSYHKIVAGLSTDAEQDRWLDRGEAGDNGKVWTVRQLYEALDAEEQARKTYPANVPHGTDAAEAPQEPLQHRNGSGAPEAPAEPEPASAPTADDGVAHIRALIDAVRELAPSLSPDWRLGVLVDAAGKSTASLRRGEQLAVGLGPSLPSAIVEAALSAMLSDLENGLEHGKDHGN